MHSHHHHHSHSGEKTERYRQTIRITLIGSVIDFLLGVTKIFVGYTAHSQALIADGIHSLSDLGTDFVVLYAAKHAHAEADEEHPYGHGRIETLATVGLALALITVAAGICFDAIRRIMNPDHLLQPGFWAIAVALISVISKELIYRYTMKIAERHDSDMLRANAWHSRTDAISSIVVIIGVAGAMMGYPLLDSLAAIAVAAMIGKIGFDLVWRSSQELIDTALSPEDTETINHAISNVDGVLNQHQLRTRKSGGQALADVHIQVPPRISVSEGHQISETVRWSVIKAMPNMLDVTVHIDAEDDDEGPIGVRLPLRQALLESLQTLWEDHPAASDIQDIRLHYLDGKIEVELYLEAQSFQPGKHAQINALIAATQQLDCVSHVSVFFRHAP